MSAKHPETGKTTDVKKTRVLVGTASQAVELGTVQAPGKRPIPAPDWARGARIESGEHFA